MKFVGNHLRNYLFKELYNIYGDNVAYKFLNMNRYTYLK